MYNAEGLIQALGGRPFSPVDLQLSTGELIMLSHPDQAVVADTDAVMAFRAGRREGTVSWRLIGLDHVVSVQPSAGESETSEPPRSR
jgi:hypothetical protein